MPKVFVPEMHDARREEASATDLHTLPRQVTRLISDARAYRIGVALATAQPNTEPVIAMAGVVPQQQRRGVIVADEHVHCAIVIEVSDGEAARANRFANTDPLCALTLQ
jgi:hypothetical protein